MPRRKKSWWKLKLNASSLQSIFALILILVGLLVAISYIGGLLGVDNFLNQFVIYLMGGAAILVPIILIVLGLNLTKLQYSIAQPHMLWGSLLLSISFSTFLGVFSNKLGGFIGGTINTFLSEYITPVGTILTTFFIISIALLIMFNASLEDFFSILNQTHIRLVNLYLISIKPKINNLFARMPITDSADNEDADQQEETVETTNIPSYSISGRDAQKIADIEVMDDEETPTKPVSTTIPAAGTAPLKQPNYETAVLDLPYESPTIALLNNPKEITTDKESIERNARIIERTLQNFGIQARIAEVNIGPSVTQYAIDLAEGTRSNKITSLQNDLALALASPTGSVRIEAPIPGKRLIGIEVPNLTLALVSMKSMLLSPEMKNYQSKLAVALGEDVSGKPVIADVAKWPHILIAGSTGSGKSFLLHTIICSILYRAKPTEVSFIMVDPKRVEFTQYNDIPHLQTPVIVEPDKVVNAFKWAVEEMERRYRIFESVRVRNLADYNSREDTEDMPYIVMIVDELADLMAFAGNEMELLITRIAQKARATGIFMILATQRPSVDVITGLIKANIPTRIALAVASGTDSRVILDSVGAEKLLGKGDMFYLPSDAGKPKRVQGVYLTDEEIHRITQHLAQYQSPYMTNVNTFSNTESIDSPSNPITGPVNNGLTPIQPEDDKFIEAVEVILNHDKASASLLQRRLKVGYARAARLLDELEEKGMVGPQDGSNPRDVHTEAAQQFLSQIRSL
ncbi:DNA translocase FtsK [candidate division WWE3 bacterium]|nr:DNA translocase FtsK [candidate division WWE3 bacterium]